MNQDEVLLIIKEVVCDLIPGVTADGISRFHSLEDLGANSMDRADVVMMVTERMELHIPLTETVGPRNIGDLADLLSEKSK